MLLKNRITRLEKGNATNDSLPKVLFRSFVSPGGESSDVRHAHIIGKGLSFEREPDESEAKFVQRVYIECVKAHGLDKADPNTLSDFDLAMVAAMASPELALKHMKGDDITDGDLSALEAMHGTD